MTNNHSIETVIRLNRFQPRPYQIPIFTAMDKGYKRIMAILPRRAGKDIAAFNLAIREALKKVGTIFYVFPTFSSGRRILWDAITIDGMRVLDYIPPELLESKNEQQMRIRFKNGSQIQIVGSDNFDTSLVGTNAMGFIFSEYALSDPRAYQFVRPILTAADGWALFISTPRGKNHLWDLWNIAQANPDDWFSYKLTVEDTKHIPLQEIEKERMSGEMSEDLIQQEYYCSWDQGIEGSYYSKYLDRMRLKGQIGIVPWEASFRVNTCWDIGVRDSTSIIFYSVVGQQVRIIDYYEKNKEGLEHYVKVLNSKPYTYGKHFAPSDIIVKEFGSGLTRLEKAQQLGLKFEFTTNARGERRSSVPSVPIEDGIEAVRSAFSKIWIDEVNCAGLIKALENYRQEFDIKRKVYKDQPLHDIHSHAADAMRYLCLSLSKTRDGLSAEELNKRYEQAVYGNQSNIPAVFRDDLPRY
jgi:phage terminase large subunit